MLTGESPVKVIAKKPCSQPPSLVEILGLKRGGKVTRKGASKNAGRNIK